MAEVGERGVLALGPGDFRAEGVPDVAVPECVSFGDSPSILSAERLGILFRKSDKAEVLEALLLLPG